MRITKSITFYLILLNLIVFFIQIFAPNRSLDMLGLVPNKAIYEGMFWQFITFMFIHGGVIHLFFNMFVLFMFGLVIEKNFGKKKYLTYYLICGIGSALLHILISFYFPGLISPENPSLAMHIPLIGASGAIFGILAAYAIKYPFRLIFVFGLIPMPAIVFLIIYGALEFLFGLSGGSEVAHFGHLGGMITGLILLFLFRFRKEKKMEFVWENF